MIGEAHGGHGILRVGSVLALREALEGATRGILVPRGAETLEVLMELRSHRDRGLIPAFVEGETDRFLAELCDGVDLTEAQMSSRAEEIWDRLQGIQWDLLGSSLDYRLIAFLYSRPHRGLSPVLRPLTGRVYLWPLMEALGGGKVDPQGWIARLADGGYLEEGELVERVRFCPFCDGGHLNYVDLCPSCGSMDIENVQFIHCFTCGRVGPKEDFLVTGEMICPFCAARLRHIGSDYDIPMENQRCRDCGAAFSEPRVSCHCLLCGQWSDPADLIPRNFRVWRLTDKGVLAAQTGEMQSRYEVMDTLNYMKPEPFRHILQWMLNLSRRPPVEPFCLLSISFGDLDAFVARVGLRRAMETLRSIMGRIKEMIRTTDVSTRSEHEEILLLLPKTPLEGGLVVARRIGQIRSALPQEVASSLPLEVKIASVPEDLDDSADVDLFLAKLREVR